MDQSLVHTFSWGNLYGPMVLKVLQKFPPTLVLVHGWLFPAFAHFLRKKCGFPHFCQKGRKGAGVKGAGVANCRIFRSAVPSVVVWSILLVSLSGVKKKL